MTFSLFLNGSERKFGLDVDLIEYGVLCGEYFKGKRDVGHFCVNQYLSISLRFEVLECFTHAFKEEVGKTADGYQKASSF